ESGVIDVQAREVPEPAEASGHTRAVFDEGSVHVRQASISGDVFVAGSFRNPAGQRSYKLYVPPNAGNRRLPLVVMLHGCTQDADDFATGTAMNKAAREQGFYVLYPSQARDVNPQKCWNWFKHNHQHRD